MQKRLSWNALQGVAAARHEINAHELLLGCSNRRMSAMPKVLKPGRDEKGRYLRAFRHSLPFHAGHFVRACNYRIGLGDTRNRRHILVQKTEFVKISFCTQAKYGWKLPA